MSDPDEPEYTTREAIVQSLTQSDGHSWAEWMADEWLPGHREEIAEQVALLPTDATREEILKTIRRGYVITP